MLIVPLKFETIIVTNQIAKLLKDILNLQIERVVDAWDWSQEDSVLHCVGLGSTYGLINSLQVLLVIIQTYHNFLHCKYYHMWPYQLTTDPYLLKWFLKNYFNLFNSGATDDGSKGHPDAPV